MRTENSTGGPSNSSDSEDGDRESPSPSSNSNNNFNTIQNRREHAVGDGSASYTHHNDSDDATSLNAWADSDDDQSTPPSSSSSEDQVDLELLHGLEQINISVANVAAKHTQHSIQHLVPKGPQKAHKIRKQGKCQTMPYQQAPAGPVQCEGGNGGVGAYGGDGRNDRMDLVFSESLNDPGFCNNLLHSLQAQVEEYPKLVTPPLSSTDCAFADYAPYGNKSSTSNYYQQYTPESLITDSPQGSDISVEEDHHLNHFSSNESINETSSLNMGMIFSSGAQQYNVNYHEQYTPESLQASPKGSDSASLEQDPRHLGSTSEREHSSSHYQNGRSRGDRREQEDNDERDRVNSGRKVKTNADNFMDNVFLGIKYFLSSYKSNRLSSIHQELHHHRHHSNNGDVENVFQNIIDPPYSIDVDRANRLKLLARIIQNKLNRMNEEEKVKNEEEFQANYGREGVCDDDYKRTNGGGDGNELLSFQMSGENLYQYL